MPCASPSVPVRRPLRRWVESELTRLQPALAAATTTHQGDRYRKHFTTWQHCCFLLAHGVTQSSSLRHTYRSFRDLGALASMSGLCPSEEEDALTVSYPQLAASSTTRPAAILAELLPAMIQRTMGLLRRPGMPEDLHILDATFLPLSLLLAPWLSYERGVQVQVLYHPASGVPEKTIVPEARHNDYQGMKELLLDDPSLLHQLAGQTLVIDRGYFSTVHFTDLTDAGIHVITRRHPQAHITVEQDLPLQPALPLPGSRITVQADQRIRLGSPTYRKIKPLSKWRQVTAVVQPTPKAAKQGAQPVTYVVLTDRWNLTAHQVITGYLWRWQVELFFRWLKRQVRLIPLLGYSENAVLLSLWLSLLVHLLLVLATAVLGRTRPSAVVRDALLSACRTLTLDGLPFVPT